MTMTHPDYRVTQRIRQGGDVHSVSWIEGTGDLIGRIYIVRNPDKLHKLSLP